MITQLADVFFGFLPNDVKRRIGLKLTRQADSDMRAFTDLFVPPYQQWAEWKSGLGDAAFVLYSLVRTNRPKVIVEIGSARGRSTCAFALACAQNKQGKVYAIDPHTLNSWTELGTNAETLDFLRRRLKEYELEKYCEVVVNTSGAAAKTWSQPIDLLFIDGDHTYDGVKLDFESFRQWLTPNSLVVFHDTMWKYHKTHEGYREDMGVPQYMQELTAEGFQSVTIQAWPGITILRPAIGGFPFLVEPSRA